MFENNFPRCNFSRFGALLVVGALVSASSAFAAVDGDLFLDVDERVAAPSGERWIVPERYRTVAIDWNGMETVLANAPVEGALARGLSGPVLVLPLPDGASGRFAIEQSPIMEPELAARYPELQTYRGVGLDDPTASLRFDVTPSGFHGMILSAGGTIYLDPYSRGSRDVYVSYYTSDYQRDGVEEWRCERHEGLRHLDGPLPDVSQRVPSGDTLRSYRTAVAATGEYTTFHGGTVPDAMDAIVVAMNRVNGVYERDVAIRMVLVGNNDSVIYTDGNTDPYTNNNGFVMLGQNQDVLDDIIGNENYDIGHVFSTGGGGIAALRATCGTGRKAQGVTGLSSPIGDVFYIDFVSHELGHQWGGNHTFNGTAGNCVGGNRNGSTAYEPGSGSTVMAYAGICSNHNIQNNSDDYFHTESFEEIVNFSVSLSCGLEEASGNSAPSVDPGPSFTIPVDTPFELCGSAVDPDGDTGLTYGWEQYNLGPGGDPDVPSGDAPIFRSFQPETDGCRVFPQLSDLQDNTQTKGEILPSYARTLTFRLMVRDNVSPAGGVDFASVDIPVVDTAGPFLVTSPNTAVTWEAGGSETIAWDVAGTNAAPISCSQVDLLLSTDGGESFGTTLAAGTANDGSETITVPGVLTSEARVKVACSDNIFFDWSNVDFSIENDAAGPDLALSGSCPGTVAVDITGATPNAVIGLAWSSSEGNGVAPGGNCAGTETGLDSPQVLTSLVADGSGNAGLERTVGAGSCGQLLQAVDLSSCETTDVIVVE